MASQSRPRRTPTSATRLDPNREETFENYQTKPHRSLFGELEDPNDIMKRNRKEQREKAAASGRTSPSASGIGQKETTPAEPHSQGNGTKPAATAGGNTNSASAVAPSASGRGQKEATSTEPAVVTSPGARTETFQGVNDDKVTDSSLEELQLSHPVALHTIHEGDESSSSSKNSSELFNSEEEESMEDKKVARPKNGARPKAAVSDCKPTAVQEPLYELQLIWQNETRCLAPIGTQNKICLEINCSKGVHRNHPDRYGPYLFDTKGICIALIPATKTNGAKNFALKDTFLPLTSQMVAEKVHETLLAETHSEPQPLWFWETQFEVYRAKYPDLNLMRKPREQDSVIRDLDEQSQAQKRSRAKANEVGPFGIPCNEKVFLRFLYGNYVLAPLNYVATSPSAVELNVGDRFVYDGNPYVAFDFVRNGIVHGPASNDVIVLDFEIGELTTADGNCADSHAMLLVRRNPKLSREMVKQAWLERYPSRVDDAACLDHPEVTEYAEVIQLYDLLEKDNNEIHIVFGKDDYEYDPIQLVAIPKPPALEMEPEEKEPVSKAAKEVVCRPHPTENDMFETTCPLCLNEWKKKTPYHLYNILSEDSMDRKGRQNLLNAIQSHKRIQTNCPPGLTFAYAHPREVKFLKDEPYTARDHVQTALRVGYTKFPMKLEWCRDFINHGNERGFFWGLGLVVGCATEYIENSKKTCDFLQEMQKTHSFDAKALKEISLKGLERVYERLLAFPWPEFCTYLLKEAGGQVYSEAAAVQLRECVNLLFCRILYLSLPFPALLGMEPISNNHLHFLRPKPKDPPSDPKTTKIKKRKKKGSDSTTGTAKRSK